MQPFFSYFGSKFRAASKYARPEYDTIIEPFAGSAGYALNYPSRQVILIEKNPVIAGIWKYLINTNSEEILGLPDFLTGQTVDDLDVPTPVKHLIGFWIQGPTANPSKTPSTWMLGNPRNFWGSQVRSRIAGQIQSIKHWQIIEGDYTQSPDLESTWFIDPPYIKAGKEYKYSSKKIDYQNLGRFCESRQGQVMVCENEGATWLPFRPFIEINSTPSNKKQGASKSLEALWENKGFSLFD